MSGRIAIVGTGPTGIYTLRELLASNPPRAVALFERGERIGIGMPYSPETASKSMLANIASIEIPPVADSYLEWLHEQPAARLRAYGLDTDDLHDRKFTPRLLLGEYFRDQLLALIARARDDGLDMDVHEETEVSDVAPQHGGLVVTTASGSVEGPFDRVILATGHVFPGEDDTTRSYFPSPWSGLIEARIPPARVGIMGTSLSSIDAAMAVVEQHGRFRCAGDDLLFDLAGDTLDVTLMSRTGVLPEADFFCPLPYEALRIMTEAAVADCTRNAQPLGALFALIKAEINDADPAYAQSIGLAALTADTFADAYFAAREAQDPFRWARKNLDEVQRNKERKITVPWRYALLRMHEPVETIVRALSDLDRDRFDNGLKKVFVDNYAAVPSESIRRLLALRDAGILSVLVLGENYDLLRETDRTVVTAAGTEHVFDVFIDARGQKPLTSEDLPFPTLRQALLSAGCDVPEVADDYSLLGVEGYAGNLVLAAIPYLMHDRPFIQGVTASADIGAAIARKMSSGRRRRRRT